MNKENGQKEFDGKQVREDGVKKWTQASEISCKWKSRLRFPDRTNIYNKKIPRSYN